MKIHMATCCQHVHNNSSHVLRVRCIKKSPLFINLKHAKSKPWSPVSVTTNPWPLAEKVSSWQIDITHYWISHPIWTASGEFEMLHSLLCSTASAWKSWSRIPAISKGCDWQWWIENCDTNIWVMWKQGIRKPQKKKRCIIRPYWTECHCHKHQAHQGCNNPCTPPPGQNGEHQGRAKNHANPLRCNGANVHSPNRWRYPAANVWHLVYLKQRHRHRSHSLLCNPKNLFRSSIDHHHTPGLKFSSPSCSGNFCGGMDKPGKPLCSARKTKGRKSIANCKFISGIRYTYYYQWLQFPGGPF